VLYKCIVGMGCAVCCVLCIMRCVLCVMRVVYCVVPVMLCCVVLYRVREIKTAVVKQTFEKRYSGAIPGRLTRINDVE